jgi:hypothetical protein
VAGVTVIFFVFTIQTGLNYLQEAHSFGVVRLANRAEPAELLALDNPGLIGLDPENDCHWSVAHLQDIQQPMGDINLGYL